MSYKQDNFDGFAQYQMGEGFGQAVSGKSDELSTRNAARIGKNNIHAVPAGIQGYEGYTQELQNYPEFGDTSGISRLAKKEMNQKPAGLQGFADNSDLFHLARKEMNRKPAGLQGFDDTAEISKEARREMFLKPAGLQEYQSDDAFAGYSTEQGLSGINNVGGEEAAAFDGYGALADSPVESFHTYLNQAATSSSEDELIGFLATAVKAVPDRTPDIVKKEYYSLIEEMLKKRKKTDLRHLDIQRAQIQSNMGWLLNPKLPKTGGFDAMLKTAAGNVGNRLAQNTTSEIKMEQNMALGRKLKETLRASSPTHLFSGFGEASKLTYAGIAILGIVSVGVAYHFLKKPKLSMRKRKRK